MTNDQRALVRSAGSLPLAELTTLADLLGQSGYFKGVENKAQAVAKVMAGAELGVPPFAAMSGIHIIEGKAVMGSTLMAGCIRKSGVYDYDVQEITAESCALVFYAISASGERRSLGVSTFTMKDAAAAGLAGKAVWKSYARNMLFARALSNGIRFYCPDVFLGAPVYTAEELDAPSGEDGGYIETTIVAGATAFDWWERFAAGVKAAGHDRDRVAWALGCAVENIRTTARAWLTEHATTDPAADVDALLAFLAHPPAEKEPVPVVEAEVVEPEAAPEPAPKPAAKGYPVKAAQPEWWTRLLAMAKEQGVKNSQIAALVTPEAPGESLGVAARAWLNLHTSGQDDAADFAYLLDKARV